MNFTLLTSCRQIVRITWTIVLHKATYRRTTSTAFKVHLFIITIWKIISVVVAIFLFIFIVTILTHPATAVYTISQNKCVVPPSNIKDLQQSSQTVNQSRIFSYFLSFRSNKNVVTHIVLTNSTIPEFFLDNNLLQCRLTRDNSG